MLVGMITLSGCATRGFVRAEDARIATRVSSLESTASEHAERIDAVDRRAQEGIGQATNAAQAAQQTADRAGESAAQAGRTAETAQQTAQQATNRVGTVETRLNELHNYSVAQTVSVQFALNSATLSDQARSQLDQIANQLRPGDFLELQGFTDSTGAASYNLTLSERRADAVRRYLITRDVPLFRITTIGLGADRPAADNATREGREQNRRVEVRLLRSAGTAAN